MKRAWLTAVALAFCSASVASAEDWWSVAVNGQGLQVSSDAASLRCVGRRCSIWEYTRYTVIGANGIQSLKDLAEYDCDAQRTRTEIEIKYDADGHPIGTVSSDNDGWRPVDTHSVGGDTLAFACNFDLQPVGPEAEVLSFSGQTFIRLTNSDPRNPNAVTPPSAGAR